MAHKKGVGSSKNGRESAAQRLGIKIFGGQKCLAGNATSSFASAVRSTILATTWPSVRMTPCSHSLMVLFSSTRASATRALFQ